MTGPLFGRDGRVLFKGEQNKSDYNKTTKVLTLALRGEGER
jgi:hypothetical protein